GPVNLAFLRSSRTQFPRVASSTPSSRAMCATGRPEDRTSATASRLNSGVYCCMNTSSLQPWRLVQGVSGRRGEVQRWRKELRRLGLAGRLDGRDDLGEQRGEPAGA